MKERAVKGKKYGKSTWRPKYPSAGDMRFGIRGYVQEVKHGENKNGKCDYVTFQIDNPYVRGNINSISIEVPYDLPELEAGDNVVLRGNIRSWWDADIGVVTYSFVADEVEGIDDDRVSPEEIEDAEDACVMFESKYQRENTEYQRKRGNADCRRTPIKHPWDD